jgi:hypothetical protein
MISDSSYWKRTLASHAETLQVKLRQRRWREESFLVVEQAVMLSCYIVRKLAEAKKITEAKFEAPMKLRAFEATGKTVDLLNNHKLEELYVIEHGRTLTKPLSYVANQLIHSFVFVPVFEKPGQIHGIAFNSDRSKSKELYMLGLASLAQAFAACANSYLSQVSYFRLENGELVVSTKDDA